MAEEHDIDVRRLRLQPGDILAFEMDKECPDGGLAAIGKNLRALLDRAGHDDVPIWLSSGGGKLTVIDAAAAAAVAG